MARTVSTPAGEVWILWDADKIISGVHSVDSCSGRCVIHRPSDHLLRGVYLDFDYNVNCFTRTCKHKVVHQDPDERGYWVAQLLKARAGSSLAATAKRKLNYFSCPECGCGCCDITSKALK